MYSTKTGNNLIDPAYGTSHACSKQISKYDSQFLHDSIAAPDATYTFIHTKIKLAFGSSDSGPTLPQAMEWSSQVTAPGGISIACVTGAGHALPDTMGGATQVADDLIANCN
jgi:hypothetical protein